ncbi:MAG: hypothetical protein GXO26_02455 [Crenarchaeota archaeon]|nr:hypothetical protein [Thermoproteota archaeon]
MGRVFVFTFGYDWSHVVAVFSGYGGCSGDVVCLLCSESSDERFESSFSQLRLVLRGLGVEDVRVFHVFTGDFCSCVCDVLKVLFELFSSCDFSEIIVDVGGGLRVLVVSTIISLFLLSNVGVIDPRRVRLVCFHEAKRRPLELPGNIIKLVLGINRLTEERSSILEALKKMSDDGQVSLRDLSYELGKDITTVRRHSEVLEELGIVDIIRTGRSTYIRKNNLTDLAMKIRMLLKHDNIPRSRS